MEAKKNKKTLTVSRNPPDQLEKTFYSAKEGQKKADDQDREGWTKYRFDVNSQNQYLDDERAKFNFEVKVGNKSPNPAIKQYLLIISN